MNHPHKPAPVSFSLAGNISEKPDEVISIVVTDRDDEPSGILENWGGDRWIYADTDDLIDIN